MTNYQPPPTFLPACKTLGLAGVEEVVPRLTRFVELLLETNRQFNLTAIRESDQAWMRHILDSLSLLPYLGAAVAVIDVGTGGGLPGIPLAILEPDRSFTLMDSTGKKVAFLRHVAEDMGLANVTTVHERAETAGQQPLYRERFDLCVSRSVAPLPTLLEYMFPFVRIGGRILCMKGAAAQEEVQAARHAKKILGGGAVHMHSPMPGIEDTAAIIEMKKDRVTPHVYPRHPGVPKKTPL